MRARVFGARGSIPVSGPDHVRYGGDTTCMDVVARDGTRIVLDLGSGVRVLGNELATTRGPIDVHVLLTHAHWDHLMGFPFFRPLYLKRCTIDFRGCAEAQESARGLLAHTMQPPFFPVPLSNADATLRYSDGVADRYSVGPVAVERIPITHPNGGCGFRLSEGGRSLLFFPDNEPGYPHEGGHDEAFYVEAFRGADVLFHDAEYLPEEYARHRGWGHSPLDLTVRLAVAAGVGRLVLWHHEPDRTDDQIDAMLDRARRLAREAGAKLQVDAAATGMVIDL